MLIENHEAYNRAPPKHVAFYALKIPAPRARENKVGSLKFGHSR
jgi:hypothetical protein